MAFEPEFKDNKDVYRIFFKYLIWVLYFFVILFLYSWQNIEVADLEYKIKKLEENLKYLKMENKKLDTEVTYLMSPERIEKIATGELKLVPLKEEDIIWITAKEERQIEKDLIKKKNKN